MNQAGRYKQATPPHWLRMAAFPVLMLAVLLAATLGYVPGREAWLTPLIVLPVYASAIWLERRYPYAPDWNRPWRESREDGAYFLLTQPVLMVAELAALIAGTSAAIAVSASLGHAVWPEEMALPLQVVLALLISELLPYWYHRLSHQSEGLLWRIHAIHHAPTRLYSLNFIRLHPLNTLASKFLALLPLALLGVPAQVIFLVAIIQKTHSLLSHANFDFRLGPLNWIFSMAELHRLHHARDIAIANGNYGSTLIVWDTLFRTRIAPGGARPIEVGIRNPEEVPPGVWRQIRHAVWPRQGRFSPEGEPALGTAAMQVRVDD